MSDSRSIKFLSLKPQQDRILESLTKAFSDLVDGGNYVLGDRLKKFETEYAQYCQANFCVGVASGLDALVIALRSLKLAADDEVIVPANTYLATWLAVSNAGLQIVPVEPHPDTFNINPDRVREAITSRTRVILPVHLYGQPCEMSVLTDLAREKNIDLVEDNAQAHGAAWNGRKTGSWGTISATSFYPTKNLGALGDGGAITTSDLSLANFARTFRNYGSDRKNYFEMKGINSRLDEIQAAFLTVKLKHLDEWNEQRRELAAHYNKNLSKVAQIKIPYCREEAFHVYHLYVVQCERRDDLKRFLESRGIETLVHYPVPPHQQEAYRDRGFSKGQFPITEKLATTVLSLPLWPGMTPGDIDYVCENIDAFYG